MPDARQETGSFWSQPVEQVERDLGATARGLTTAEAERRLTLYGANRIAAARRLTGLRLLLSQFRSPIILVLLFAAVLSGFLGDPQDATIILVIVVASGILSFWQERGADDAVTELLAIVEVKASVVRDGIEREIPLAEVVPGDVVELSAGSGIPADALVLEAKDLYVDEAALTGETFPVEKGAGVLAADTPLGRRTNTLFMGTHVTSGGGTALVVATGTATEFGKVSERLSERVEETEFEHGLRRFGYFLVQVALVIVMAIFAVNVYLHKPVLDSFEFSLALAIGITPQLLPAIVTVNLARGAQRMARSKVIVKRLSSIDDFGSMDILCSDKTGTLTEGIVRLHAALDVDGENSERVQFYAYLNSAFESGFQDPIDDAIRSAREFDLTGWRKLDEEPFDFVRKRLSVLAEKDGERLMVTKGSLRKTLEVCVQAASDGEPRPLDQDVRDRLDGLYQDLSSQGYRTLGVATREVDRERIEKEDERCMTFAGVLVLFDPPKEGVAETVRKLRELGVTLKVITGDNALVAATVDEQLGLPSPRIMTGSELHAVSETALARRVADVDIFADVEPNQKEDIVRALKRAGHVVGYLGDGINDASGLYVADVGISVNSAVDVAKEAADIVLLEKDLGVLCTGVTEGRATFANTLKYVYMSISGNFGNMVSMAGASLFLPFLPLLPTQILLGNLLTDLPAITISTDTVDPELVDRPRRWNVRFLRDFMVVFGPINSVCDYLTFAVLLLLFHAGPVEFHSGWWVENVFTASLIVLVIRTRRAFWRSRPSTYLVLATAAVVVITLVLPYTPKLGPLLGLKPIPAAFLVALIGIQVFYIAAAEVAKHFFYGRHA